MRINNERTTMSGITRNMIIIIFLLLALIIGTNVYFIIKISSINKLNLKLSLKLNDLILSLNNRLQLSIEEKQRQIESIYLRILIIQSKLNSIPKPTYLILPDSSLSILKQEEFIRDYENEN